jgi:glycosyltransferase involved in cell wall biosynthesis
LAIRAIRGIPVVFDVHEDLPGQLRNKEWIPLPFRPALAALARLIFLLAESCLTITLAEQGYQRRFRKSHVVLPNYPDIDRLPLPSAIDSRIIVYVGDVREVRGALVAVEAVAQMAEPLPLVLVGRCPPPLAVTLRERASSLGVELSLPGFLPHAEAMAIASQATVGISPLLDIANYRWSLPTKVLEYLALGVPVVASDLPGTAEVVVGLETVQLVPAGDARALAGALDQAVSDPTRRKRAQRASAEVRRRFAWPADRLRAVYLPEIIR